MAARIRSRRNGITPIDEASRDDLVAGDVVTVSSLDAATTYAWTLTYVPEGSTATFSGVSTAVSPGSFTVDLPGAYMVRLVVDAGLQTQSTQYVRLRALTTSLGLSLIGAGERRDGSGVIPVDIDPTGWADEHNNNLLLMEAALAAIASGADALTVLETGNAANVGVNVGVLLSNAAVAAPVSVVLPDGNNHLSKRVTVKDKRGTAGGVSPITLSTTGGQTIDGAASATISSNYGSLTLVFEGTEWSIL